MNEPIWRSRKAGADALTQGNPLSFTQGTHIIPASR
jgi:hypothetical protein